MKFTILTLFEEMFEPIKQYNRKSKQKEFNRYKYYKL